MDNYSKIFLEEVVLEMSEDQNDAQTRALKKFEKRINHSRNERDKNE